MNRMLAKALWALSVACTGLISACSPTPTGTLQGYVEGEFVLLAAPTGGYLQTLAVQRGDHVAQGQALFALEATLEQQALAQAEAQAGSAQARQLNLQAPRRSPEIQAAQAQWATAQAALRLSRLQMAQQQQLASAGFVSETALAAARAAVERDEGQSANAQAVLDSARSQLGRQAEIQAAHSDWSSAQAAQAQARTRLAQKSLVAPTAAVVQDSYFRQGEWVPAGVPVLSLLPPEHLKLRFFVSEARRAQIPVGSHVSVRCDGCGGPYDAVVRYVSAQAEYTPPVIYSREARQKLVYLVEARPEARAQSALSPGQPVDVVLP